jgi:hypothetical protein
MLVIPILAHARPPPPHRGGSAVVIGAVVVRAVIIRAVVIRAVVVHAIVQAVVVPVVIVDRRGRGDLAVFVSRRRLRRRRLRCGRRGRHLDVDRFDGRACACGGAERDSTGKDADGEQYGDGDCQWASHGSDHGYGR